MLKSYLGSLGVESPHDGAMDVLPLTLNKKNRPTWYRAEIATMGYEESCDYAGRKHTGWCYDLYSVNGKGEKVPEAFMIPLPKEDAMRENSAGRMINKFPDPDFLQHPQATSQKTEGTISPREFLTAERRVQTLSPKRQHQGGKGHQGRQRAPMGAA